MNADREAALQQHVDEEGCGAVVLALRLEGIRHPMLRESAQSYPQVRIFHGADTLPLGKKFRQYQDDEPF